MKRFFVLSMVLSCIACSYAQLKTYSGPFKLGVYRTDGTASYSYREVNDERVKEGKFTYNFKSSETISIAGEFKDNKKNGHWKLVSQGQQNSYQNLWQSNGNREARVVLVVNGAKTIIEGDYVEGLREGRWTCSKINVTSHCSYKSEVSFLKGKFYGNFIATYKSGKKGRELNNISINGQFVEGGLPDGKWTAKWTDESNIEYLYTLVFDKGKPVSHKKIDQSTGKDVTHDASARNFFFDDLDRPGMQPIYRTIRSSNGGEALPFPFRQAISGWCMDEAMFTPDRNQQFIFLNWE